MKTGSKTTKAKNDAKKGEKMPYSVVFSILGLIGKVKIANYADIKTIDGVVEKLNQASQAYAARQEKIIKDLGHEGPGLPTDPEKLELLERLMRPVFSQETDVSKEDLAFIENAEDFGKRVDVAGMEYGSAKVLEYWLIK